MLKKRRVILTSLLALVVSACQQAPNWPTKETTAVLSAEPVELGPEVSRFSPESPAEVVGGLAQICVVLEEGVSDGDSEDRISKYQAILGDNEIFGSAYDSDGQVISLMAGSFSWRRDGHIGHKGELSSCLMAHESDRPPVGATIQAIEVEAKTEIRVLGVYFSSSNAWDTE